MKNNSEHLVIDDQNPHTDIRARRNFGTAIKRFTVNDSGKMEQKYSDAFTANPFWRLTISLNDNPDDLLVLPPMDSSIEDKIMFFKLGDRKGDKTIIGTATQEGRKNFADTIRRQLPAFLHYLLNEHRIPEAIVNQRFGVGTWHHSDVLKALLDGSPEGLLLSLIDSASSIFFGTKGDKEWSGPASDIERKLTDNSCSVHERAKDLLGGDHRKLGAYLRKLEEKVSERVSSKMSRTKSKVWTINPPR